MTTGGVEWEQGQAVTRMVQALLIGDHEAMAMAMADYAAALGTRTTSILSGIVATVMLELQQTRLERQTDARIIEHKLDLILLASDAMYKRIAAVEDVTLAHTLGSVERQQLVDFARTIPDLTARVERLEAAADASAE
mgnify:CR=1 FL=1